MKRSGTIKRNTRTAGAKGLRDKCDKKWSLCVRLAGRCAICGKTTHLQAHHMIKRDVMFYRHDLRNGVCLCPDCHKFSAECSAHGAPWEFEVRMGELHPVQSEWWQANRYTLHRGERMDYAAILDDLTAILEQGKTYKWMWRQVGMAPPEQGEDE